MEYCVYFNKRVVLAQLTEKELPTHLRRPAPPTPVHLYLIRNRLMEKGEVVSGTEGGRSEGGTV